MRYGLLRLLIGFITLSLVSCGFQLRGATQLSPALQKLYIQTADPYGPLTKNLVDYLKTSGVQLTENATQADTVLHIIRETTGQQLLSVGGTQQTRQYNLSLTVVFELTTPKGAPVVAPYTLTENRTFTTLSDQILGGTNEQNTLYQQMRLALVYDIMSRLSSRDVTQQLVRTQSSPPLKKGD